MTALERGLWPEAFVAGLATLSVAWPLTDLLTGGSWLPLAVVLVVAVAATGALLRSVGSPVVLVPLAQLLVGAWGLALAHLPQTLWYGLPTTSTAQGAGQLLGDAGSVLQTYAAPAPTTDAVAFLVVAVLVLTAVAVDAIGVTGRSPAVAGIPLAAAFLVSVSNSGEALSPWFFLATGGAWLLMMAQQGARSVDEWPSRDRREHAGGDDVSRGRTGHRWSARALGAVALVAALSASAALPHLPPTFFADGLARNPDATELGSSGGGQVSFVDTMDPGEDLRSQSEAPVLDYTSTARVLEPLKVTSTTRYEDGRWLPPDPAPEDLTDPATREVERLDELSGSVPTTTQTVEVLDNNLQPPHLATPSPLTYLDTRGQAFLYDPAAGAVVLPEGRAESYRAGYVTFGSADELPGGVGEEPVPTDGFAANLGVPEEARGSVGALVEEVVGDEQAPLAQAVLIQNHLRSGEYLYSLELGPTQAGVPDEPISQFLANQQGYCVQFATAMVMMARDLDIPARMAVGFLPGTLQPGGGRSVIASDAHTWPELYLDGLGWTRFEPTPGIRTGPAPGFTQDQAPDVEPTPTPTASPVQEPDTAPDTAQDGDDDALTQALTRLGYVLAVLAVVGALLLLVPLAGRWWRRRELHRAGTPSEEVEAHWLVLTRSLTDLGVPEPPPASPRAMRAHYDERARLDPAGADALGRVTTTLERVRYAPHSPEEAARQVEGDVDTVLGSARGATTTGARLRARWFPVSGLIGLRQRLRRR